jgi:hypothetical protein
VALDRAWWQKALWYHVAMRNMNFYVFMKLPARIFLQAKQAAKPGFPTSYEGYIFLSHTIDRGPGPLPASVLKKKNPLKHPGNRHLFFVVCIS